MNALNDPVGYDEARREVAWTPARGLIRGTRHGLIVAAVLAILLIPLAVFFPYMIIPVWLRAPLTFGLAWLLFHVVQRGAGMVGLHCSLLAIGLTALVLISNHLVFAISGVPDPAGVDRWWVTPMGLVEQVVPKRGDLLIGWEWCHPYALLTLNLLPLVLGGGFSAALCKRG